MVSSAINWDNHFSCPLQAFKFSIYSIIEEAFGNKLVYYNYQIKYFHTYHIIS